MFISKAKMFDKIHELELSLTVTFKVILILVITCLPVQVVIGCCWLKDPDFQEDPEILKLNTSLIRVQFNNLDNLNCVDHFYIYFWETKK